VKSRLTTDGFMLPSKEGALSLTAVDVISERIFEFVYANRDEHGINYYEREEKL
jgi:hypothetical protein